ncbi:MAG: methyltransferase domain-containing protein, partial [Spirochaetes bacterium]|nr:methyltransferase domain-containing protein [Spirochaetota bacterium]
MPRPVYEERDLEAMGAAPGYARWIHEAVKPALGASILEVGAGSGNLSRVLLETGIRDLVCLEPSLNLHPALQNAVASDPRCECRAETLAQLPPSYEGRFDTVLYINVLEHIEDDAGELVRAARFLKSGGQLGIFVPALRWLYGTNDRAVGHFRRYQKPDLGAAVQAAGFHVTRLHYFDVAGVLPWWFLFRVLKLRAVN